MGKSKRSLIIAVLALSVIMSGCQTNRNMIDKTTVKDVNIEKYLGTWYEIARFDHSFERGLVGVTATYSLEDNGRLKVINQGHKNCPDGELSRAVGKAKVPDENSPGRLKVSFFWFFYAEYNILELDTENYQWALIGSSSPKYLWILSRTPQMDQNTYSMLVNKAKQRGYNTEKLMLIPQKER